MILIVQDIHQSLNTTCNCLTTNCEKEIQSLTNKRPIINSKFHVQCNHKYISDLYSISNKRPISTNKWPRIKSKFLVQCNHKYISELYSINNNRPISTNKWPRIKSKFLVQCNHKYISDLYSISNLYSILLIGDIFNNNSDQYY